MSTSDKAVNTDPHYLSISRWQSAEWKSERSKPDPGTRARTAPLNRYKPLRHTTVITTHRINKQTVLKQDQELVDDMDCHRANS